METKQLIKAGKDAAIDTLLVTGGIIVANGLVKVVKQDNAIGNGAMVAAGIAGAMFVKNPMLRMMCVAGAAFGGLRLANIATNEVVKSTDGLAGMIPDSIKLKIRQFIPTLGSDADLLMGGDDDMGKLPNLDDAPTLDIPYVDVTNQAGIGATELLY